MSTGWAGGHDEVAKELRRRLSLRGWPVEQLGLAHLMPGASGRALRIGQTRLAGRVPRLSQALYQRRIDPSSTSKFPRSLISSTARQRLVTHIEDLRPAAIVSTFGFCSRLLGEIKQSQATLAPTIAFAMDAAPRMAEHHRGIDLSLYAHPGLALEASNQELALRRPRGPGYPTGPGPILRAEFGAWAIKHRLETRRRLELAEQDRAVLILGGTQASGDLMETFGGVADLDGFVPIAVCGENDGLYTRLRRMVYRAHRHGVVLGWENDMAALMAGADVVVDHVGGLACLEAMACQVPVICFLPRPGQRRANVEAMARAGLVDYVVEPSALPGRLEALAWPGTPRLALVRAGQDIFVGDVTDQIEAFLTA
ncbi:MAG: glycosyltransferase [Acidimicrobiales bacterium]